jgi:hypothetical protein
MNMTEKCLGLKIKIKIKNIYLFSNNGFDYFYGKNKILFGFLFFFRSLTNFVSGRVPIYRDSFSFF